VIPSRRRETIPPLEIALTKQPLLAAPGAASSSGSGLSEVERGSSAPAENTPLLDGYAIFTFWENVRSRADFTLKLARR
jgi:hypothetical protein